MNTCYALLGDDCPDYNLDNPVLTLQLAFLGTDEIFSSTVKLYSIYQTISDQKRNGMQMVLTKMMC